LSLPARRRNDDPEAIVPAATLARNREVGPDGIRPFEGDSTASQSCTGLAADVGAREARNESRTEVAVAATVLGWREWVALPQLGLAAIRAKIDSGARSSALHVEALSSHFENGAEWVCFSVRTGVGDEVHSCHAPVLDRRPVTDSGGHVTERVFIRTRMSLGGADFKIEINLTNRRNMLFPMLLGRTAMAGRFLIDPERSFVLGDRDDANGPAP
jgi:hypothetical protein